MKVRFRRLATAFALPVVALLFVFASQASAQLPPIIPREVLFGNPERAAPQLSPDGRLLAYLAPDNRNVLQVWVRTVGQTDDRVVTNDRRRGIRSFRWTYNPDQLIYSQDLEGDENFHLYLTNIRTNIVRDITPFQGVRTAIVALEPDMPNEALVTMNLRNRERFDVYRVNLTNGLIDLDTENAGTMDGWVADSQMRVRAAIRATPDGGFDLLVRNTPADQWRAIRHWPQGEQGGPAGFSQDGRTLYVTGNHEANAARLLAVDVATGRETVLAEDAEYDVSGVMIHPRRKTVEAVAFYRDRLQWRTVDSTIAPDFEALGRVRRGDFNVISRDLADRTWLVSYVVDNGPVYYYTYNRQNRQGTLLFSQRPRLENLQLAEMRPINFRSRDGLTINGYLTTPVGVPARNLPTVLLVHGGPWARDTWGFRPEVQWLANRGYAVLQVNYRGSTGYGKRFQNASVREFAGKMHEDLIDGVNWVVSQGIADRSKVAIMGGSYGGYATLVGLTFTPDVFAAGIDIVGPSNLASLIRSFPPYWRPFMEAYWYRYVGNPDNPQHAEDIRRRSPLFRVDQIRAPLLIAQGANDPRVTQAESDQMVEAMRRANKPVEYVVYTDEGHGFARPENRLHFYALAEQFLSRHLGGRFEPMTEIRGHSGVVR